MTVLESEFIDCYGISKLSYDFDFSLPKVRTKAFSIYAPNGLMKTSFTRTFLALSKGEEPEELRFNRTSSVNIKFKGDDLKKEQIYVVKSEIDINSDDASVTNLLINAESKSKFDEINKEIEDSKKKLTSKLNKICKVKVAEVESKIISDFGKKDLYSAVTEALNYNVEQDYSKFVYGEIFDPQALNVINSDEFKLKAREFVQRYDDIFNNSGLLLKKGVFNSMHATNSCDQLDKNKFFQAGHKVLIQGEDSSFGLQEFKDKINAVTKEINSDKQLNTLKKSLEKNANAQKIQSFLENSDSSEIDLFISKMVEVRRDQFKKELWSYYLQSISESQDFIDVYSKHQPVLLQLESEAKAEAPKWETAINLFNSRFVDMPFKLDLYNKAEVILGKEKAILKFIFTENGKSVDCRREDIKALSQGEKRALYLLNFIFDVEDRKNRGIETLFIIDDIADSFDYKNKHAIIQYLDDLTKTDCFYQIILTHNFDFYRSLANAFVNRKCCLMANKLDDRIELKQSSAINDIFQNKWKNKVDQDDAIMCSCIPFARNIIEYISGEDDEGYLKLTKLLHWKDGSDAITVGEFFEVYNSTFNKSLNTEDQRTVFSVLFDTADTICDSVTLDSFDLQEKVLLSIAIRVKAEKYITRKLREIKGNPDYWFDKKMFGPMLKLYETEVGQLSDDIITLREVSVTVSSNIHLNSFMYEPILDLSHYHLIELYKKISAL